MTSIKPLSGTNAQQVTTTSAGGTQQTSVANVTPESISKAAFDRREDGIRAGEMTPGGRGDFPSIPRTGPPIDGPGFGQETLDKCFSSMDALEQEMKTIDPTSPEGSRKMMEIERKLQRIDQLVTTITNMRRMIHEMNMQAIRSIVN
jgi:hypothetical protein